ncbi:MAG: RAMP superfamily CRISPR-associated protein [Oscillospiraceae bacterium]|nr:RAMP superfamily CRISPR-associated protein [Oscillospiraceae bacterium]
MKIVKKQLEIKLMSDMICGTGEGDGISVDISTAFDDLGIPYIPAKRLKGLLRESAKFLVSYGYADESLIDKLFGTGNNKGALRINNALIKDYDKISQDIIALQSFKKSNISQSALSESYSSTRAQTAIDEEGIAKRTSLRKMQAISKSEVPEFYANINIQMEDDDTILGFLEDCAKTLRHIGMNKTRGFGEVRCELKDIGSLEIKDIEFIGSGEQKTVSYKVELIDDIVLSAGSKSSGDFINGTMMQGAFAQIANKYTGFVDVFLRKAIFSDAFVDGCDPVPLSIVQVKNKGDKCFNLADGYVTDDEHQYIPVNGYYQLIDDTLYKHTIRRAVEYHYSTEIDTLFTYRKITKEQVFSGTLTAPADIIETLQELLKKHDDILTLGGSSSAQYAKCKVSLGNEIVPKNVDSEESMIIETLSDIVVRDIYGAVSGNVDQLMSAFKNLLNFNSFKVYTKTITNGGFNSTWKLPIPQYSAFVKGTVIELHGCEIGKKLSEIGKVSDINTGGTGMYRIRPKSSTNEYQLKSQYQQKNPTIAETEETMFARTIESASDATKEKLKQLIFNTLKNHYIKNAVECANTAPSDKLSETAAMRLFTAWRAINQERNVSNVNTQLVNDFQNSIKNEELKNLTEHLINGFSKVALPDIIYADEAKEQHINTLFNEFTKAFLNQIKRNYRKEKRGS